MDIVREAFIQYIEKIRDTSEEPETINLASKFLTNDLIKIYNTKN